MNRVPALLLQKGVGHTMSNPEVNPFLSVTNPPCSAVDHSVAEAVGGPHHKVSIAFFDIQHKMFPAVVLI